MLTAEIIFCPPADHNNSMKTNNNTKNITTAKVAAVYIGTVVGAGFATGQELMQFFGFFGVPGIFGLMLAAVLFVFFGVIILELGRRLAADSHRQIIQYAGGRYIGTAVDGVITFFLFGALTAMAAGAGAVFQEQFGLPPLLGSAVMVGLTVITVIVGISGVINAISYVVPVLLVTVFGIAAATLLTKPVDFAAVADWAAGQRAAVPFWPLAALTYVSYNLVLGISVLGPLGKHVKDTAKLRRGALWGGVGLGAGALAINLTLLANIPAIARYEVPMIYAAGQFAAWVTPLYSTVLLAEIYTTAVGSLYGFAERITDQGKPLFKPLVIFTGIAAFGAGQFGFSNLVRVLFPAVGYAGLIMLAGLTYGFVKERLVPVPALKRKN